MEKRIGSKEVAIAAMQLVVTQTRDEETELKDILWSKGIKSSAVDFGGDLNKDATKVIERAVVAAKRENVIKETHVEEGAVAGAAREALSQVYTKALGFHAGGKIAVARHDEHVIVCIFFQIGLLHLNEIAVGLGHRVI